MTSAEYVRERVEIVSPVKAVCADGVGDDDVIVQLQESLTRCLDRIRQTAYLLDLYVQDRHLLDRSVYCDIRDALLFGGDDLPQSTNGRPALFGAETQRPPREESHA